MQENLFFFVAKAGDPYFRVLTWKIFRGMSEMSEVRFLYL
jgi:hypothetical protein